MYQQRTAQQDMNGFTFSVNIPVFYRSKQRQAVAEATQDVLSAEKMHENRVNELRFELKQNYLAAKAADRLITLYSKGIVPQSSLALESSMAGYQVGKVDFLSMLANFTTVLNYETDYYRKLADYLTAIARMESLTGVDITAPATDDSSIVARKGF
jgi:outer membrane protein TolC